MIDLPKTNEPTIREMIEMAIISEAMKRELIMCGFKEKELRHWEFGITHPDMIDLEEIGKSVSRDNPLIVVQNFRKETYTEMVKVKKQLSKTLAGKPVEQVLEKEVEKVRTVPVSDNVTIIIHNTLMQKAKTIGHLLIERVNVSNKLQYTNAFVTTSRKTEVETIVKLAKEVKHASFDDKKDKQFIRVMMRKI